ncbi:MAG TPA: hypothetical protein VIY51_20745 [Xanthobacteraceae bacterium]
MATGGITDEILRTHPDITAGEFFPMAIAIHEQKGCQFFHGAVERLVRFFGRNALVRTNRDEVVEMTDEEMHLSGPAGRFIFPRIARKLV